MNLYWEKGEEEEYIRDILQPEQKEIEKTKWALIQDLKELSLVKIRSELKERTSLEVAFCSVNLFTKAHSSFLDSYLGPFLSQATEKGINIYYLPFENEYAKLSHPIWWEKTYYTRTKKEDHKDFSLIQRNFIGLVLNGGRDCIIRGPKLNSNAIDTVDNLFLSCVAPKLIDNNSLALHAATVAYNNEAYVFYGPSGVGKSTIAEFCYEKYGHKVMSGDQIYLHLKDNKLYACPCVSTINGFSRSHPGWESRNLRVRGLTRLFRSEKDFVYESDSLESQLKHFLKEVVYLPMFGKEDQLIDLVLKVLENSNERQGSMAYKKGHDFWNKLLTKLGESNE